MSEEERGAGLDNRKLGCKLGTGDIETGMVWVKMSRLGKDVPPGYLNQALGTRKRPLL